VLEGLKLLKRDLNCVRVDEKALETAFNLYTAGHRDLIDSMLYGISLSQGLKLLTIDRELEDFVKKQGYSKHLYTPRRAVAIVELLNYLKDVEGVPEELYTYARELDRHYIPSRYPNAFESGYPALYYDSAVAERALNSANKLLSG
jgi:hypothetical protein